MTRKARFAVAAVLCVFGAGTASAQSTFGFGVMAGGSFALGDLKPYSAGSTGWHVGGVVDWKNALSPVSVRASVVYDEFGVASKPSIYETSVSGPITQSSSHGLKSISGIADVVWNAPAASGSVSPYFMGGLGVYQLRPCTTFTTLGSTGPCDADPSIIKSGANAGAGVTLPMSSFKIGVEATYHYVFGRVDERKGNASFARLSAVLHF